MAYATLLVVGALVGGPFNLAAAFGPPVGPYNIIIQKMEACEDGGNNKIIIGSKITSGGKGKYFYNSPLLLQVPWDKNLRVHGDVHTWGNGGYRPHSVQFVAKGCQDLWKYGKDIITGVFKAAGVEDPKCPIPMGNYTVTNWELNVKVNNIPMMEYKKYKLVFKFYHKDIKVGCEIIYTEVVPKNIVGKFKLPQ